MRALFIGCVLFSREMLEELLRTDIEIVGVCARRSSTFNADHVDLGPMCAAHSIDCKHVDDINDPAVVDWIRAKEPDVIFCFGWSSLLRADLLAIPPLGVIGFHPANLPANRGRHPIIWALVLGLTSTASTFFFMDEGADSGDILSQVRVPILEADDASTLYRRIVDCARDQVKNFVAGLSTGSFPRAPQDHGRANYWRKRSFSDGVIDWRMSAKSIHNLVRGLTRPYIGAHFVFRDTEIKVWRTECFMDAPRNLEPGKILAVEDKEIIVKCGEGAIRLLEIEPPIEVAGGAYL
jgi:methionyl-tRNA formyltransferase